MDKPADPAGEVEYADDGRPRDYPPPPTTIARIARATREFLAGDTDLLEIGVNERSLTHRLAVYIGSHFSDWHVDCEYNRLGEKVKNLPRPELGVPTDDTSAITIFPDIIVHRRRTHDNCAVVEVKKAGNTKTELDVEKLRGMTMAGEYEYTVGLHLIIDCDNQSIGSVTAYRGGDVDPKLTALANRLFKASSKAG